MTKQLKRRRFIETSAKGLAAAGILTASSCTTGNKEEMGSLFLHHVFFWLKEPVTAEVRSKFESALRELITVETIVSYHLGIPASTGRDVIDGSYTYSLFTTFRNKEDQDIYQTHPTHLKFIEDCSTLWERVVVYDTVSI